MAILKNRPLFSACLLYIICVFCARFSSSGIRIGVACAGIALLLLCLLLLLVRKLPKKALICAMVALLCITLAFASAFAAFDLGQQKYLSIAQKQRCNLTATVTERTVSDVMTVYRIRVQEIDGKSERFDGQLVCNFTSYLQVGDQFTASVLPATYEQIETVLYDADYALADGLRMQFTCEQESDIQEVKDAPASLSLGLTRLNDSLCDELIDVCGKPSGSLISALLLGNKSFLSETLNRDFERVGASHMLALSGMHVSILIGALGWLLSKLHVHRKARAVFLAVAAVGYLLLTGASVSACRAVVMVCFLQLSYLLAADNDTLTTLGLVGAGILLLDPFSVCDTGFILSFLATFGIVVLVPPLHTYLSERTKAACKLPHKTGKRTLLGMLCAILETLLIGCIACFAIMVPSCFLIGHTSLLSPLTTLLLSPVISAMLVLGAVTLLLSPIPPLANIFATLIRLLFALITPYISGLSQISGMVIPLTHTAVQVLCVLFCLGMLVLLILPLKRKIWLSAPPLLLALSLCIFFPLNMRAEQSTLRAVYTRPSSVSEALVSADGYRAYICDLSSGSGTSMRYAMYAAKQLHATEIGALLLTDYHTLHGASLTDLFSAYKTELVYLPLTQDKQELDTQARVCEIAQTYGVEVAFYQYGQPVCWYENTTITVYRTDLSRSEQPALIVTLERGEADVVMLSAAAEHAELNASMAEAVADADAVVCMERGPKPRVPYSLSGLDNADVVFASRQIASYCNPDSLAGAASMTVCPEIVYFGIATKENP